MTRLAVPSQALPPRPSVSGPVLALLAVGAIGAGVALASGRQGWFVTVAAAAVIVAVLAGILLKRRRRRQELADVLLLKVSPLVGWPEARRTQVAALQWRGGWVGHPAKIRVRYNPLAGDALLEIVAELRALTGSAFGVRYKLAKHTPRIHLLVLAENVDAVDETRDAQVERVDTLISKTFGAAAKATPKFSDSGSLREITVQYEVTPRLSSPALRGRIESSVSSALEGRWRAFWDLQHDTVRLEVRPELSSMIPNPNVAPKTVDPLATYDKLEVPVGMDEDGNPICWRPKRDPHGLITGKTGKGKTVVLLGIIMFLAAHGWKIWGIDGKRIELLGLREWPNVQLIAGRIDHQARVGHELFTIMQRRFADYEAGRVKLEDFEPVLFVIDEYKTFRNAVTRWFRTVKPKGPGSQAPVVEEISDFVSLARKVRMHLVIGLQRPDAEFLTGDMRDNFNFRVSLGRLSPEGAKMMWDSYSTGVAIPPFAIGRGIAHNAQGTPVEIQTYWTPDPYQTDPEHPEIWVTEDDLQLVDQLRPASRIHELKRICEPQSWVDLDDDKGGKDSPDYNDYMAAAIVPAGEADQIIRKAAALPTDDATAQDTAAVLERIQSDAEEPEEPDDLFAGYGAEDTCVAEHLLDEAGELGSEGIIALVDSDAGTWGLLDSAEYDLEEDGYIALTYRDFETGEPSALSVPADEVLHTRSPEGAGR